MAEENQEAINYAKRPLWHWLLLYAAVAVVLYGLFYYFVLAKNSNSNQVGNYQQSASPTTAQTQEQVPDVAAQKITIEGNEFAFTPSTITLKKGQLAEITFKNTGKFPHDLSTPGLGVKSKTIAPGEQDVITFTPDKTGSFPFDCTIGNHAEQGMIGTLTVE
jgi:plastocyanin